MKVLLLTHAFNGLAQRLFVELRERGHEVSVELDIADAVTEEAVALFDPDVVLAPFLKRRIPESVWSCRPCLVVHPGPPGDRGPSSLDWALLDGEREWGVTVLQASEQFDAGAVWAARRFVVPAGTTKASLYRNAVSAAAVEAVLEAIEHIEPGCVPAMTAAAADATAVATPATAATAATAGTAATATTATAESAGEARAHGWRPLVTQAQRGIDWAVHDTAEILRRVRSADGFPGAVAPLFGEACRLFDAHESTPAVRARAGAAPPGTALARRGPAILVSTRDGALWIGHVRRAPAAEATSAAIDTPAALKLAATRAFAREATALPEFAAPLLRIGSDSAEWDELRYHEFGPEDVRVGWLDFEFHNGALSQRQASRLVDALSFARGRATRVLVLAGGRDFFSNGIHLHEIEAAATQAGDSAADASWRHINAIDDVALQILQCTERITVSALRGNAGAGGCFLALAADHVWAREGIVLNPHYKNMGNLYGSEYWTYLLPRRVGGDASRSLMRERLPIGAAQAVARGLADAAFGADIDAFEAGVRQRALALAASTGFAQAMAAKAERRAADEACKPLAAYRDEELERVRRNFYGFDPSYHVARHHFVHRKPHAWTPRHLALHR